MLIAEMPEGASNRMRIAVIIMSGALGACSPQMPVLCAYPYDLTAAFIVTVPAAKTPAYARRISAFMKTRGMGVTKASYPTSEPPGMTTPYTGYQVVGCDGQSKIWSSNEGKAHEYLVTFHRNPLFKDRTVALRNSFISEFRRGYRIRTYVDWRS